jgi:hypothetical protein
MYGVFLFRFFNVRLSSSVEKVRRVDDAQKDASFLQEAFLQRTASNLSLLIGMNGNSRRYHWQLKTLSLVFGDNHDLIWRTQEAFHVNSMLQSRTTAPLVGAESLTRVLLVPTIACSVVASSLKLDLRSNQGRTIC